MFNNDCSDVGDYRAIHITISTGIVYTIVLWVIASETACFPFKLQACLHNRRSSSTGSHLFEGGHMFNIWGVSGLRCLGFKGGGSVSDFLKGGSRSVPGCDQDCKCGVIPQLLTAQ